MNGLTDFQHIIRHYAAMYSRQEAENREDATSLHCGCLYLVQTIIYQS